jgi:hypothetical protein
MEKWNREIKVNSSVLKKGNNLIVGVLKNDQRSVETFFDLKLIGNLKNNSDKKRSKKNRFMNFFRKR